MFNLGNLGRCWDRAAGRGVQTKVSAFEGAGNTRMAMESGLERGIVIIWVPELQWESAGAE